MHRRVRQENSQVALIGRDGFGGRGTGNFRQQHDGPLPNAKQSFGVGVDAAESRGGFEVRKHHSERFLEPTFALAQPLDRLRVRRIHRKVESAQPLHGNDLAGPQLFCRRGDGIPHFQRATLRVPQFHLRPAFPAGVGLRVETAIPRIFVLGAAFAAHRKPRHRRARAVVGDSAHDAESRPAIGAVNKRIEIAAVGRIEQFAQAIRASGHVGRNQGIGARAVAARQNFKAPVRLARHLANGDAGDLRQRGSFLGKPRDKFLDEFRRALHFNRDAGDGIGDVAFEIPVGGKPVDVRAKSHTLDDARNQDFLADLHEAIQPGGRNRSRLGPLPLQPVEPVPQTFARLARHSDDFHIAMDLPRVAFGRRDIERHIG